MGDRYLRAHMARRKLNEAGKRYGSRDHFDLWCVVVGILLLAAAGLWLPVL